jgi:hypothetical protein
MKTLKNRTNLTEDQRQEVYDMAGGEDGEYTFRSLRYRLTYMYAELEKNNGKTAYSAKDAMYQSFSDSQDNYKRTGRY